MTFMDLIENECHGMQENTFGLVLTWRGYGQNPRITPLAKNLDAWEAATIINFFDHEKAQENGYRLAEIWCHGGGTFWRYIGPEKDSKFRNVITAGA